jgi:hypothetical protein
MTRLDARERVRTLAIASAFLALHVAVAEREVAFEGKIDIFITRGNETTSLLYTVGENFLRIEVTGSNWPNPIDIVDLKSGGLTLVFPHNRSFMRLNPGSTGSLPVASGSLPDVMTKSLGNQTAPPFPTPPGTLPPGVRPQPQMPPMPMSPGEKIELKPTGKKEKILGYACQQFEIKARGETMEIWATDKLIPFQDYVRNQPSRFGPRMIEEQWAALLIAKKLFSLRATLRLENGPERFRFEVKSITPEKIDNKELFHPPPDYSEIQPLPF